MFSKIKLEVFYNCPLCIYCISRLQTLHLHIKQRFTNDFPDWVFSFPFSARKGVEVQDFGPRRVRLQYYRVRSTSNGTKGTVLERIELLNSSFKNCSPRLKNQNPEGLDNNISWPKLDTRENTGSQDEFHVAYHLWTIVMNVESGT